MEGKGFFRSIVFVLLIGAILSLSMTSSGEDEVFPEDWITISLKNANDIEFSPDGSLLAAGLLNGTVVGFNLSENRIDWVIRENYSIQALEWTYSDGDLALAIGIGASNNTNLGGLKIYSVPALNLLEDLYHNEWISCLSADPTFSYLAVSGLYYPNVDILNTTDWTLDGIYSPGGYVTCLDYSDMGHLAVSSYRFIEFEGKPYRSMVELLYLSDEVHLDLTIGPVPVIISFLEWKPNSHFLAFGNESIYLADTALDELTELRDSVSYHVSGSWDRTGQILYYSDYLILHAMDVQGGAGFNQINNSSMIKDLDVSPDNSMMAIATSQRIEYGRMDFSYTPARTDTDSDGYPDTEDRFPYDPGEWNDTDNDGFGDNSDRFPEDPNEWNDTDNDGFGDNVDAFPYDPDEWVDSDGDGVGNNSDRFPENPNEWMDTDNDGRGDNSDEFPKDSTEWKDTDKDGIGDNSDEFPFDPSECKDTDGDGVGDNSDRYPSDPNRWKEEDTKPNITKDSDNDTVPDDDDSFPNDPAASVDMDRDGYPDKWNPGMSEKDSTTGLELDRFLNDPRDQSDNEPDDPSLNMFIIVPLMIFIILILFSLVTFVVVRSIGKRKDDLTAEEERIRNYIHDIVGTESMENMDEDSLRVLLEDSRFEGRISDSTYRSIAKVLD